LEDEDIVVIPVVIEAAESAPTRVHVDEHERAQGPLKSLFGRPNGGVRLVDGIPDKGCAPAKLREKPRRVEEPQRAAESLHRPVVGALRERLAALHQPEARRRGTLITNQRVEAPPRQEPLEAVGAAAMEPRPFALIVLHERFDAERLYEGSERELFGDSFGGMHHTRQRFS
jgi:hypothetical protein